MGARFLTRDPLEATTHEAYRYVGGNPITAFDPYGLCWGPGCWVEDAVGAVVDGGQAVGGAISAGAHAVGGYVVDHRAGIGQIVNLGAGATCVASLGTACAVASGIALGYNTWQNGYDTGILGPGDPNWAQFAGRQLRARQRTTHTVAEPEALAVAGIALSEPRETFRGGP